MDQYIATAHSTDAVGRQNVTRTADKDQIGIVCAREMALCRRVKQAQPCIDCADRCAARGDCSQRGRDDRCASARGDVDDFSSCINACGVVNRRVHIDQSGQLGDTLLKRSKARSRGHRNSEILPRNRYR